ncbi:hypothetical protein EON65_45940 [archaeon]|nr:MAG: hypothetical protein EON65_45940 [archaeon]
MSIISLFAIFISCLFCGYAQESVLYDVNLILAPNFVPFNPTNSSTPTVLSLVNKPNLVDINDTAAWIEFTFNGTSSGSKYPEFFEIELCEGLADDWQFIGTTSSSDVVSLTSGLFSKLYHVVDLLPLSVYRVRVVPVFKQGGKGNPSAPLPLTTLTPPINYWEQILPRRSALGGYGRGLSDPVLARPHLTPGVEVYDERTHGSNNTYPHNVSALETLASTNNWYTDAPHSEARELPSGRRGASLTLMGGKVYMFGGRTNGMCIHVYITHHAHTPYPYESRSRSTYICTYTHYMHATFTNTIHTPIHKHIRIIIPIYTGYSCASVLKDTVNMGLKSSGLDTYPCVSMQAEVCAAYHTPCTIFHTPYIIPLSR